MARSALVTGASTGIGAACAGQLAGAGWTVFAGVRRTSDGDRLVNQIAGDVHPVILDVADDDQIQGALDEVRTALDGRGLHGLVNNAGIGQGGPVELVPMADWRQLFDVNFFGAIAVTKAAFDVVREGAGRFVYIGSQNGRISSPGSAPYAASKHALEALCESMRHELASTGMRVSLIEPGQVKTAIWDKITGEIARAEEMLAASPRSEYDHLVPAARGFVHEGATKGIEANRVAKKVLHALTAARPKARYLVGPDAKVAGVVSRLPDPLRDRLVGALVRRYARIGTRLEEPADQPDAPRSSSLQ